MPSHVTCCRIKGNYRLTLCYEQRSDLEAALALLCPSLPNNIVPLKRPTLTLSPVLASLRLRKVVDPDLILFVLEMVHQEWWR